MDWRGADYTTSLTLGNIDVVNGSGVAVTHYLQQVTKNVALGTELAYQYGSQVPGGHIAVYSLAGRYTGELWGFIFSFETLTCKTNYSVLLLFFNFEVSRIK